MSKHTPGPWFVEMVRGAINGFLIFDIKGADGIRVCHGSDNFSDVMVANARVIAAAPEMLEALTKIKAALMTDAREPDKTGDVTEYRIDGNTMYHALNAARAAIAKAEGR